MLLSINDVLKIKNEITNQFGVQLHFHDGCGGQYFTFDESNLAVKNFIINYFENQNIKAIFSNDNLQFILK